MEHLNLCVSDSIKQGDLRRNHCSPQIWAQDTLGESTRKIGNVLDNFFRFFPTFLKRKKRQTPHLKT
jgi:hypothetical protein